MKTRLLPFVLLMLFAVVVSACGGAQAAEDTATATPPSAAEEVMEDDKMEESDEMIHDEDADQDTMKKDGDMDESSEMAKEESDDMMKDGDEMSHDGDADQGEMKKEEDMDASSEMDEKKDGMDDDGEMSDAMDTGEMAHDDTMMASGLTLEFSGLEDLGEGWAYEGWLIVDGAPVSTGTFTVDAEGMATATHIDVDEATQAGATTFVLTIEPSPDTDPSPSAVHLLAGDFDGENAQLSIAHPAALANDFSDIASTYILGIPTSDSDTDAYTSGIWFNGLNLPELPAGWAYEGWVAGADGPISTGRFTQTDAADSDGAGPTAGPKPGPALVGQDYLNPAIDLTSGYAAVISIEPEPDNSPAPFTLKPLVDENIDDVGDHVPQDFAINNTSFPTGVAVFADEMMEDMDK